MLFTALGHVFVLTLFPGILAILVGVVLGYLCTKRKSLNTVINIVVNTFNCIPSMAFLPLVYLLFLTLGISTPRGRGDLVTILVIFFYSLLPIVKNTITGLNLIPKSTKESAIAMGMTKWQMIKYVEFPLSIPSILVGVKVTLINSISIATIGFVVGSKYSLGIYYKLAMNSGFSSGTIVNLIYSTVIIVFTAFLFDYLTTWLSKKFNY